MQVIREFERGKGSVSIVAFTDNETERPLLLSLIRVGESNCCSCSQSLSRSRIMCSVLSEDLWGHASSCSPCNDRVISGILLLSLLAYMRNLAMPSLVT